ncbi:hypothetical protein [Streptomyces sp. NPDC007856]|uniref:hypothetical protein n=1 Tax=Streptomyces sp. NPDC007856 TaxID=3364781 RepID=UPI003673B9E2
MLLAACGRTEQAIEEARARLDADSWYGAQNLAELLAGAGRPQEAVARLDPAVPANRSVLAALLVELGRIKDAVALLRQPERAVRPLPWTGDDLPF